MTSDEIEFIKNELKKSGFLLEDKIATFFSSKSECEVDQNYFFDDWQTNELRELDLRIEYDVTPYPIQIRYIFLIECKQLPGHSWVFIRSRDGHLIIKDVTSMWDHVGKTGRQEPVIEIIKPIMRLNELDCDTYSHRYKEIIQNKKIQSNKRDDNIFTSSIKLAKAIHFENIRIEEINAMLRDRTGRDVDRINIIYPMIIFDGKMYEATLVPEVEVKPISSAHLYHFSIQDKEEQTNVIDIIQADYLKTFFENKFILTVNQLKVIEEKVRASYLTIISELKRTYV